MNESNFGHHGNEGPDPGSIHHAVLQDQPPYWKCAHPDWRMWVGLVFMLAALTIYVVSDNLALLQHP